VSAALVLQGLVPRRTLLPHILLQFAGAIAGV